MQDNKGRDERLSRLIETLKAEAENQPAMRAPALAPGYRYPRSRWSAPTE